MTTLSPELEAIARAQAFFSDYAYLVRDWEVRPHQRSWFSALQALADGVLRHPDSGHCEKCRVLERQWITSRNLPYDLGYQALCGKCITTNKLLILAFFGSGKTDTVAEWLEWLIGRSTIDGLMPKCGLTSYADDVASGRSVAIRDTIGQNLRYRAVFPEAKPAKGKSWSESEWSISRSDPGKKDPTFRSAGWEGALFSFRFSTALVMDDPADPDQMPSPTYRDMMWYRWRTKVRSRIAQGRTPVVFISNRFADDDLPGRVIEIERDWFVIETPALINGKTAWPEEIINGEPMGISTEALVKMEAEDPASFAAGYMCQPPSSSGGLFESFATGPRPAITEVMQIVQFWDTATSEKSYSDPNAMCEWWKLKNGRAYLAKVINQKAKDPTIMIQTEYLRSAEDFENTIVVIENGPGGAGATYVRQLQNQVGVRVKLHNIGGGAGRQRLGGSRGPLDMRSRAAWAKAYFDQGTAYIPQEMNSWRAKFIQQMMAYTGAKGDPNDMIAAAVGGLEFMYPAWQTGRPQPTFSLQSWTHARA